MAVKDEYEVARLYTAPAFRAALAAQFEGEPRLRFHLAPPILAQHDSRTGVALKRSYGPWMMRAFRVLAPLRFLRGTAFDPFGHTEERRAERRWLAAYDAMLDEILLRLRPETLADAVALAALPERISGFGHIKERAMREAEVARLAGLERLRCNSE
jgi:indolepyruvate ferredoxin oxidoreductase